MPPDPEQIDTERRDRPRWIHGRIPVVGLVGGIGAGKSRVAAEFARRGFCVVEADRIGHAVLRDPEIARRVIAAFGDRIVASPVAGSKSVDGSRRAPSLNGSKRAESLNGPESAQSLNGSKRAESRNGSKANASFSASTADSNALRAVLHGSVSVRSDSNSSTIEIDRRALGRIVFADPAELRRLEAIVHPPMRSEFERLIRSAVADRAVSGVVIDAAILFEAQWNDLCDYVVFVDSSRPVRLARLAEARGYGEADLAAREATQTPLESKLGRADFVVENDGSEADLASRVDRVIAEIGSRSDAAGRGDFDLVSPSIDVHLSNG
jgi:dephospho-CoA kinase